MRLEDLGRHADRVERLVEVEGSTDPRIAIWDQRLFLDPILDAAAQAGGRGLGLDQVIERAELQAAIDEFLLAVVGQDDDRNVLGDAVGAKVLENREAVHLREPNVKKDDVRNLVLGVVEPLLAGLRDRYPVAIQLQLELVHLRHCRIIFDKEDVYVLVDDFSHVPSLDNRPLFHAGAGSWTNRPLFHAGAGLLGRQIAKQTSSLSSFLPSHRWLV